VPEARIRADLTAIARQAKAVRTYASTLGLERVPKIAAELGLNVTLGAWIGTDSARNEREIASALDLARHNPMSRVWSWAMKRCSGTNTVQPSWFSLFSVSNERVRFRSGRGKLANLHRTSGARRRCRPDLCSHHPYWEGVPRETAVDRSLEIYDQLQAAFPGKTIVVGELGWPSAGRNFEQSMPRPITQAVVLRDFVARATALGIDYNIVEAIDQPEKLFEAMSVLIGASSMRRCGPNLPGRGGGGSRILEGSGVRCPRWIVLSLSILLLPGATIGQVALLAGADHVIGDWCASVLATGTPIIFCMAR